MKIKKNFTSKNLLKNRRGSHIGAVISFMIFITFLVFLYSIMEPAIKIQGNKKLILDSIEVNLLKLISSNLTTKTITINEQEITKDCIKFVGIENLPEQDLIAIDSFGNFLEYNIQEQEKSLYLSLEDSSNRIFKLYNSIEFDTYETTLKGCKNILKEDYNEVSSSVRKYAFESRIFNITKFIESDYENFKELVGVPAENEIEISFTFSNGTKIETGDNNSAISIYSKDTPIQYVDWEANILSGILNIKIW